MFVRRAGTKICMESISSRIRRGRIVCFVFFLNNVSRSVDMEACLDVTLLNTI